MKFLSTPQFLRSFFVLTLITALSCFARKANAQDVWTSTSGNAWLTGSNWTGSVVPTYSVAAEFDANPTGTTGVGILFSSVAGTYSAGAVYISSLRGSTAFLVGNNGTTPGILTLNGTTVSGVSSVVLANLSSTGVFTVQNTQGSGTSTMGVALAAATPFILGSVGASSVTVGSTSYINSIVSGTNPITFLGNGTYNVTTVSGNPGGLLRLNAANTFSGGLTVGKSDGTSNGILELDNNAAINNVTGNNVTINKNSQLYLTSNVAYATTNLTLNLNGYGNLWGTTNPAALLATGVTASWTGPINLQSTSAIVSKGTGATCTLSGNISGSGGLTVLGKGTVIISGSSNTWTGGTTINNGGITVSATSSLSAGPLTFAQNGSLSPIITLNDTIQTVSSLSSSFTAVSGVQGNILSLAAADTLTINQSTNTTYGTGSISTLTSVITGAGSVVKKGTGILTLTSSGNTFSGGLTITGGELRMSPLTTATVTLTSTIKMNGGKLGTSGIAANSVLTLGTLKLSDNSTINFDSVTIHMINFAASNATAWTAGKMLTITNWQGSYTGGTAGTTGRIFVGTSASALTSAQLAQIQFYNGTTYYPVTILSTGELVPSPSITISSISPSGNLCNGRSNVLTVVSVTTGVVSGTYSVQASNASGVFSDITSNILGTSATNTITATIPAGFAVGTYNIRVLNGTPLTIGTAYSSSIVISASPSITATANSGALCAGNDLQLNTTITDGLANYTYSWSGPNSFTMTTTSSALTNSVTVTAILASPSNPVYTVAVTDANSCTAIGTTTATVNPLPSPTIAGSASISSGGSAILTFSGNSGDVVYYWNGASTVTTTISGVGTSTVSVSPTVTTTYSVTSATSAAGCTQMITGQTTTVTVTALPTANIAGSTTICEGSSATITFGGTAGATVYYWDGGIGASASIMLSGTSGIGSATVSVAPSVTATYTLTSVYSAGSSYTVSGSVVITVSNPRITSVYADATVCAGNTLHLSTTISGGFAPYTYLWNGSGSYTATTSSSVLTNSVTVTSIAATPSSPSYTVTVTDNNGCIASGTSIVSSTVVPIPSVYTVSGGGSYCSGSSGSAISLSGSDLNVNYQLYNGASATGSPVAGTGSTLSFGSFTAASVYSAVATSVIGGCSTNMSGTATVTIITAGSISGSTTIPSGGSATLSASGTPGGTWTSSSSAIASVTSMTGIVSGISMGTVNITYTAPGCSSLQAIAAVTIITPSSYIWTGNAGDNIWSTAGNWAFNALPSATGWAQYSVAGTSSSTIAGTSAVIATYTTSTAAVGAIDVVSGRTVPTTINSDTTGGTTLTLNGTTVYSVTNTVLSNANGTGTSYTATPLNLVSGTYPLNIVLNNSAPVILGATGTSSVIPSSTINVAANITASVGPITFLGNGTWNGVTGNCGGILRLGGVNTFTNTVTVGNSDGTSSGILELDAATAIQNSSSNNITINNNSQLYLAAVAGTTYSTSATTLYLNGFGNAATLTGAAALFNLNSGFTWPGAIVLSTTASIASNGAGNTFTVSGPVTGTGGLVKSQGKGTLVFSGSASGNTWSGGTSVNNGNITVNSGSGLGSGPLTLAPATTKAVIVTLNNASQNINGLSSTEAGTTAGVGSTLTLNGTTLTVNQTSDGVYGTGIGSANVITSIITGTGTIIKIGSANLILSSPGHTFTGGFTLTNGGLIFNPSTPYRVSLGSSPVTLNGGTLGTYASSGTYSVSPSTQVSFSTLNLQSSSSIVLDPLHTHTITFANSNSTAWTTGQMLTITNWQGDYSGGTSGTEGSIFVGMDATGLTASQLAQVQFSNSSTNYPATLLNTGELVPSPNITISSITPAGSLCNGSSNVLTVVTSVTGSVSGTYSVQASNSSGVFSDYTSNILGTSSTGTITATVPAGFATGTYNVRLLNGILVSAPYSPSITVYGSPSITATSNSGPVCAGSTLSLNVTISGGLPNYNYLWKGPLSFTSGTLSTSLSNTTVVSSVSATPVNPVYTVTITDAHSCTVSATTTSTVNPSPSATLTGSTVICTGSLATISVTGGTPGATVALNSGAASFTLNTSGNGSASVTPTATTIYTATVTSGGCSPTASGSPTVTVNAFDQWQGSASTAWSNTANWLCGTVPVATQDVVIPGASVYSFAPTLDITTGYAKNLTINSTAALTLGSGNQLNITGNVTNNAMVSGPGVLYLNGSSTQIMSGNGVVTNLTLANSAGATLNTTSDTVGIKGTLLLNSGTFTTKGSLMLVSDSLNNGIIGTITGGAITGNVVMQQWIIGMRRAYRFIAHPYTSSIPLSQIENYIDITGRLGSANGFTTTMSNAYSAYWYHTIYGNSASGYDPGWRPFTNTSGTPDSNNVHQFQGLRLFVRGAKGEGLDGAAYTPSAVTYRTWGAVNTGSLSVTMAKGSGSGQDFNLLGNPYPSNTDVGTVINNASVAGKVTGAAFYIWNPHMGTTGQYISETIGTAYYIGPNESFEIRTAANGNTLSFAESNKVSSVSDVLMRNAQSDNVTLYIYDETYHPWDIFNLRFNDAATDNEDAKYDGAKPPSPAALNFYSLSADGVKLALDGRPFTSGKAITLGINSGYMQNFIIKAQNLAIPTGEKLYLHDKYLQTYTLLEQGTEYKFTITKDAATQGDQRFELSMNPTGITAQQANLNLDVVIIPNPATNDVTITYSAPAKAQTTIRVMNMEGVTVRTQDLGMTRSGSTTIALDNLASGVYLVELTSGNDKLVQRLIKE